MTVQGPVRVLDLTFNQVLGSYTLSGGTLSTDLAGSARAAIWTMNDDAFVSSTVIGAFEVRGPGQLTLAGTGNNTRGATAPSVEAVVVAADARLVLGKESGPAVHAVGGKIHVVDRSRITLAGTGGDQIPDDTEIYGIGSVSSTLDLNGRSETLRCGWSMEAPRRLASISLTATAERPVWSP